VMSARFANSSMTLTGAGGGRGGHVTYTYRFSGTFSGTQKQGSTSQLITGSISTTATTTYGGGAPGKVSSFSLIWNTTTATVSPREFPLHLLGVRNRSLRSALALPDLRTVSGLFAAGMPGGSTRHSRAVEH
jgi:hypothetical protein